MTLGFIGLGTIASAVVEGIAGDGHSIMVSERSTERSSDLAARYSNVRVSDNQTVADQSDLLFLGTTAQVAADVLSALTFRPDQRVVSFMVGMPTVEIKALIAPAVFEAIMIPFPSIADGGSPVLVCPNSNVIADLFGIANTVISLSNEGALNDFLAAQAVLSPSLKMVATAVDWLGDKTGDPHGAEQFLRVLIGGSIMAKPMSDQSVLPQMIEALNTPGGLNREFREFMETRGMFEATKQGLDQLARRLSED